MRIPDRAGLVEDITFEWLVLDGERHDLDPYVEVISSYDPSLTISLIETKAHYVHLGLEDGKVVWISVLGLPFGDPPRVLYVGSIRNSIDRSRIVLTDGTVLTKSNDVQTPTPGQEIRALIDPTADRVVEISPNQGLSENRTKEP